MNNKTRLIVILLISISIITVIFSFFAPYIFTQDATDKSFDFTKTGSIGDTLGGLMNPFIALAGVFITFLAFYMQFEANKIQIDIFNKNQKEQIELLKEQMFFRLTDNLSQRIINFSHIDESKIEFSSYKALDNLIKRFFYEIDNKCVDLGRQLLVRVPEGIEEYYYMKILEATTLNESLTNGDALKLKNSIVERIDVNDRWEYMKVVIGHPDKANIKLKNVLKSIAVINFYNIDYEVRQNIYVTSYNNIYQEYGGFMDGY